MGIGYESAIERVIGSAIWIERVIGIAIWIGSEISQARRGARTHSSGAKAG